MRQRRSSARSKSTTLGAKIISGLLRCGINDVRPLGCYTRGHFFAALRLVAARRNSLNYSALNRPEDLMCDWGPHDEDHIRRVSKPRQRMPALGGRSRQRRAPRSPSRNGQGLDPACSAPTSAVRRGRNPHQRKRPGEPILSATVLGVGKSARRGAARPFAQSGRLASTTCQAAALHQSAWHYEAAKRGRATCGVECSAADEECPTRGEGESDG